MRKKEPAVIVGYDYSTAESREETVERLFSRAKNARSTVESEWRRCNDYYNFVHDVTAETGDFAEGSGFPWRPAVMPDPWIMVESQIDPTVPEPEFHGRDDDMDSEKAKQREYAVRYIIENNRLSDMNTRNERRLLKYGDAFWKAYWDGGMRCGMDEGDIRVKDIPVDAIFPDPSVRDGSIQDGQYLDYVYSIHKVSFCHLFRRELDALGIAPEEILSRDYVTRGGVFDMTAAINDTDDTVQILEHWFRQPFDLELDGRSIPAGSVACSILAGGRELRYIPNYWEKTGQQNQLFPFVHYWRIQDENRIWNRSELFPILDLVDAADRKLNMALMNDAFMANDIVLVEDGALADGAELTNEPGAVVRLKQNRMGGVARLGGLNSVANAAVGVDWLKGQIERANRNYDTNTGRETARQTTATALAMQRADASSQHDIKTADRNAGFERLYELLDWLALEFFDDGRMLFLGADREKEREATAFRFFPTALAASPMHASDRGGRSQLYFPRVDVTVTAGDSIERDRRATLQELSALAQTKVTAENWRLLAAELEILSIPGKQEIIEAWRRQFEAPPEEERPTKEKRRGVLRAARSEENGEDAV